MSTTLDDDQIVYGTNRPVPPAYRLNVEMLHTLVKWAMRDQDILADPAAQALAKRLHHIAGVKWDQGSWAMQIRNGVCRTAGCIAGGAVMEAGYVIDYGDDFDVEFCYEGIDSVDNVTGKTTRVRKPGSEREPIARVAKRVLGLTSQEEGALFEGGNRIGDIVLLARTIAAAHGVDLGIEFDESMERYTCGPGGQNAIYEGGWTEVEDGILPVCRDRFASAL